MSFKRPPSFPIAIEGQNLAETFNITTNTLEKYLTEINQAAAIGYSTSNITETKTLNGSTASLADVINVLGTLINVLKTKGLLDD
jgi:hypothetical protein|tara:strand:- start:7057 stop:7311 length:255 start_codon:yes stop_codon:yes gene_type:complete